MENPIDRHIVFLKKHKCASSTIYEILNRYKKKHKMFAASKPIGKFKISRKNQMKIAKM